MSKKTTAGHGRRIHSAPHGHTTLQDWRLGRTPAPRRRRMSNYAINLAFLETYARENGYALSPPPTGLDGAPLHAMGGPKRLLPQERLRGLPRPGHLPRLRRAAGNVCGGDRPPRGQAPMAKPWQLRLLPKRGDGADRPCLTRDATMPATICLIAPPSYRAKLLRPTTK